MACCGHGPFFGFGLFLLIFGFLLDVSGVATPYWVKISWNGIQVHMGLWQSCISGPILGCNDIGNSKSKIVFNIELVFFIIIISFAIFVMIFN